ncbi:MAG: DinB family protein [Bacteroidetes bacterium]|nr:DinB family protein [Bacteroidota bacterium]
MHKPHPGEYNSYFKRYLDLVPDGNFIDQLKDNTRAVVTFFESLPLEKHAYSYAPGKWTVKQVLLHLVDTERVMSYRALAAARGDERSLLPGMDENLYAANATADNRSMDDILGEFNAVRLATLKLFENVTNEQSEQTANIASHLTTTRALGYIIIGHAMHHLKILQDRYL